MKTKDNSPKAILMIVTAAILWGCIGIFIRNISEYGFDALEQTTMRLVVITLSLFIYLIITDRSKFKIKLKDIKWFLANGVFSICFFFCCYTEAIKISSLATAAILLYTAPILVMIMSMIFFKEKLTLKKFVCMIMAFIGCALVTGVLESKIEISARALLLGLGAGFGYSLYSIFSKILLEKYSAMTNIFYTFLVAMIASFCITDMSSTVSVLFNHPQSLGWIICSGVFNGAFPYIFYTSGLKYVKASKASVIASIEPVTAAFVGVFIFKEQITSWGLIGIMLVLGSIIWLNIHTKKSQD